MATANQFVGTIAAPAWATPSGGVAAGPVGPPVSTLAVPPRNPNTAPAPNPITAPNYSGVSPTYLAQLFPQGLPQAQAATVGSVPQATAYTATPYTTSASLANPSLASATGVDTSGLGANALVQQILGAEQPVYQQQRRGLVDALAGSGIVGGSTAGALNDLAVSQDQQSLAALAPFEQTAQQTQLGANEYNANAANTNSQVNAGILNNMGQFNAAVLNNAANTNAAALNANSQYNAGALNNASQYNTGNLVNTNNLNSSILNANSQFNTNNALNSGQIDANTANTILGQLLGFENQDYITQLNNQEALQQAQMTGTVAAGAPVYQQPQAPNFASLAGAFGTQAAAAGAPQAAAGQAFGVPSSFVPQPTSAGTLMGD